MNPPDRSRIDQAWPSDELEQVDRCPYCASAARVLAYRDVQDWSFYCAPGKWTYWDCTTCGCLYLDPRPTIGAIGRTYETYYTRGQTGCRKVLAWGKDLVRNLCYFAWHGIALRPRLALPGFLFPALSVLRHRIAVPSFILEELNRLPRGRVVDVGCGDGGFLDAARQLGWRTLGIELDPEAAKVAAESGHEIIVGTYEALADLDSEFDCLICSHVLEHVHDPKRMLAVMSRAMKRGAFALISLPNAGSIVRQAVTSSWRGLEAPRHLAIPTYEGLLAVATSQGFEKVRSTLSRHETLDASLLIARQRGADTIALRKKAAFLRKSAPQATETNADFINLVLRKSHALTGAHGDPPCV